jgi:hypothetical protein
MQIDGQTDMAMVKLTGTAFKLSVANALKKG